MLSHLDAAYNLARWLTGNDADAHDVVQTAAMRAWTYLDSLRGNDAKDAKAWLLGIVRNCCMTALGARSERIGDIDIDAVVQGNDELDTLGSGGLMPEHALQSRDNRERVNRALRQLPVGYREVLILREMEEMAYEQIADIMGVPLGTVMSRLSRARASFKQAFLALNMGDTP